jgi:hypothetical protein
MAMIAGARVGGQPYESVFFFLAAALAIPKKMAEKHGPR